MVLTQSYLLRKLMWVNPEFKAIVGNMTSKTKNKQTHTHTPRTISTCHNLQASVSPHPTVKSGT